MCSTIGKFEKWRSKRKVPKAICCSLQTCIVVISMSAIEYIMYTNFRSYQLWITLTHLSVPIIMYNVVVVYSKQHCLQLKKVWRYIDMYIPTKFHGFIYFGFWVMLVNAQHACAARVTVSFCVSVSVSVCVSVYDYSRTTGHKAANERYQQLLRNMG